MRLSRSISEFFADLAIIFCDHSQDQHEQEGLMVAPITISERTGLSLRMAGKASSVTCMVLKLLLADVWYCSSSLRELFRSVRGSQTGFPAA